MTYGLIAICPYVIRLGLWARNARTGFRFVETPRSEVDLLLLSDANGNMTTGTLANHWTWDALKRFDPLDPRRVMEITLEVARLGESLSRTLRHGENFSPGTLTPSSAAATHSDDIAVTPPNPVR